MSSLLVFNRVYRLEIQSVMLVFSTGFVNHCPSNLLSGLPPPLLSSLYAAHWLATRWSDAAAQWSKAELKSRYGARNRSRNRVWNWVAKLHRLAGRYDNPMPIWFLTPIAGLKLPSLTKISERNLVFNHPSVTESPLRLRALFAYSRNADY